MSKEVLYDKLAELAVRRGVNVQKGQPLVIRSQVSNYKFVEKVVAEAYRAGASEVEVDWKDSRISVLGYNNRSEEQLADVPQWIHDREAFRHEKGVCYMSIVSEGPDALKEADPKKILKYQAAYGKKMQDLQSYTVNNIGQWTVFGIPSTEWATRLFPELEPAEAFAKLEDAIFQVSRVTEDTDVLKNWQEHDAELAAHAKKLNEYQFKAIHFTSELGTDLTVGLVKNHLWAGGSGFSASGVEFDPNIPTEEVFCMPECKNVNGIVYASKPLSYGGSLIENFWLKFENGIVVDFGAEKCEDALKALLDTDEGSRSLGEVALVPYDSPISQSGILFCDTLYDENAACHLALGMPYPENLQGGNDMSEEELKAHGANASTVHEDFMFGTRELCADGILEDGTEVPVFRNGNFVF